jgi:hypothetical protein
MCWNKPTSPILKLLVLVLLVVVVSAIDFSDIVVRFSRTSFET